MPGGSGFELFDRTNVEAHVVFVTAFDEFALRAFEVNALDYLTKPVKPERLRRAIDRYLKRVHKEHPPVRRLALSDSILITIDRIPRFVKVCSIECVLAEGDYTRIVCAAGCAGLVLKSMNEWERILPQKYFCRIGRSTIVNCEQIARFEPNLNGGFEVFMKHLNAPLTMTRRFVRQFRARYEI